MFDNGVAQAAAAGACPGTAVVVRSGSGVHGDDPVLLIRVHRRVKAQPTANRGRGRRLAVRTAAFVAVRLYFHRGDGRREYGGGGGGGGDGDGETCTVTKR